MPISQILILDGLVTLVKPEAMADQFALLDSSVLINILASDHVEEVLKTLTAGAGVCTALRRIEVVVRFRPPNDDPLLRWWLKATAQP